MSSLAAQLQQKKNTLKGNAKTNPPPPPPAENSGSSTSSGGSGNYGTIGRTSTGMASMMDEMAKTLARRRAQAEKKPEVNLSYARRPQWTMFLNPYSMYRLRTATMDGAMKNQIHCHINWVTVIPIMRAAIIVIRWAAVAVPNLHGHRGNVSVAPAKRRFWNKWMEAICPLLHQMTLIT